ncbi:hypothetical protein ATPR_3195 [Acetobacter tropicalis NBRC 101654]|uniref:Uncharacterized protein n=1 Tax=Acetobacter tropicalis NBRC 101654 TaxID=749388 RepID=F7VIJ6_9PROT|nr:hypothetical protein ATPR_3195 [Acetobacter tropicalis NBRC 101654]
MNQAHLAKAVGTKVISMEPQCIKDQMVESICLSMKGM